MLYGLLPYPSGLGFDRAEVYTKYHIVKDSGESRVFAVGIAVENDATATNGPVPPLAPTGFRVTSQSTEATLAWTDTSSNETGFEIGTCIRCYLSQQYPPIYTCTDVSPLATVPANSTSYRLTGLSPGSHYRMAVRAFNAVGNSSAQLIEVFTKAAASAP
jgi:hypothetical protein